MFVLPATRRQESMARLGRSFDDRLAPFDVSQEKLDFTDDAAERRAPQHRADMVGIDLHSPIDLVIEAACRTRSHNPVPPRPESKRRHRRLAVRSREGRFVYVVAGHALVELANIGVGFKIAREW